MKKRRQALQGYKKKGSTFYPPFLTKMEDAGMTLNSIDWRSNMLPELFWLAPLVREFGILKSCTLAWTLSNAAREAGNWDKLPSIGAVSSFADLTSTQKSQVRRRMQAVGVLGDLRKSIDPLVRLYPKFPLKFLLGREKPAVKKSEAMQYLAPLLAECLFRNEKLPTLVQGVAYAVGAKMGKYIFNKDMNPPLPQDLEDYPESDKSQRAAAFIRALIGNLDVLKKSCSWPEYFWQRGNELGECKVPHDGTVPLWAHTQEYILFQSECFYRYSDESQEIWQAIEKDRKFDLYSPLREEILFGLAARIYRLTVQILSFAPNWVEDIGQVVTVL